MICFLSLFLSLKHPFRQQCSSSTHLKENIHKSYALSLSRTNSLGFQIPWFVELCKFRTKSSQDSYSVKWSLISMNSTSVSAFFSPQNFTPGDAHCFWQQAYKNWFRKKVLVTVQENIGPGKKCRSWYRKKIWVLSSNLLTCPRATTRQGPKCQRQALPGFRLAADQGRGVVQAGQSPALQL